MPDFDYGISHLARVIVHLADKLDDAPYNTALAEDAQDCIAWARAKLAAERPCDEFQPADGDPAHCAICDRCEIDHDDGNDPVVYRELTDDEVAAEELTWD